MKRVSSGPAERAAKVPDLFWSMATKDTARAAEEKFESKGSGGEGRVLVGGNTNRSRVATSQNFPSGRETERGGQG